MMYSPRLGRLHQLREGHVALADNVLSEIVHHSVRIVRCAGVEPEALGGDRQGVRVRDLERGGEREERREERRALESAASNSWTIMALNAQ